MAAKKIAELMVKVKNELAPKKALVTPKYLDISTGHVTHKDMVRLEKPESGLTVYPFEYGCWVSVSQDRPSDITPTVLEALGYSDGFVKVYMAARKAGCWFIKLDQDGETYEQFAQYEW